MFDYLGKNELNFYTEFLVQALANFGDNDAEFSTDDSYFTKFYKFPKIK